MNTSKKKIAIYIHIPFCIKKCSYCDFFKIASNDLEIYEKYTKSLIVDIEKNSKNHKDKIITSVFIGGGTPSVLPLFLLEKIINSLQKNFNIPPEIEFSIEANPNSFSYNDFYKLKILGVNRVSLGVQSFDEQVLLYLERAHNKNDAKKAIASLEKLDFNFNLDFMFAIKGQSLSSSLFDLEYATKTGANHISRYQLTIEKGTKLYFDHQKQAHENQVLQMIQHGNYILNKNGFENYEISAFAKKKFQCIHNLNYWQYGDYLAFGAGSHSKISNFTKDEIIREKRNTNMKKYIAGDFIKSVEIVAKNERVFEYFMNICRTKKKFTKEKIQEKTNLNEFYFKEKLNKAVEKKLIKKNKDQTYQTTDLGRLYLNNLLEIFL